MRSSDGIGLNAIRWHRIESNQIKSDRIGLNRMRSSDRIQFQFNSVDSISSWHDDDFQFLRVVISSGKWPHCVDMDIVAYGGR